MSELDVIKSKIQNHVFAVSQGVAGGLRTVSGAKMEFVGNRIALKADSICELPPELPIIESKPRYHVDELLQFEDAEFIRVCYLAILEREPEENGANYYLNALRDGKITKPNIIYLILKSEEGQLRKKEIKHLLWKRITALLSKILLIGGLRRILSSGPKLKHAVKRQEMLLQKQAERFDTFASEMVSASIEASDNFIRLQNYINQGPIRKVFDQLENETKENSKNHRQIVKRLTAAEKDLKGITSSQKRIEDSFRIVRESYENNDQMYKENSEKIEQKLKEFNDIIREAEEKLASDFKQIEEKVFTTGEKVKLAEEKSNTLASSLELKITELIGLREQVPDMNSRMENGFQLAKKEVENVIDDDFYLKFQEAFIKEEAIYEVAIGYLPFIKSAVEKIDKAEGDFFLDIGCGSGILLEILRKDGIYCKGIETNAKQFELCRNKGLEVEKSDALSYVESLPDECLTGVSMIQVVEHLDFHYLRRLFERIYLKMKPGAILLCETVNPYSLVTLSRFWLDFSHHNPIPPEGLKFLAQYSGFRDCEIQMIRELGARSNLPFNTFSGEPIEDVVYGFSDYLVKGFK